MKNFNKTLLGIALAFSASQASAAEILFDANWGFNWQGTGLAGALAPIDEMTYLGISYTESTGITAGSTFKDVGRFGATSFQNDGSPIPGGISGLGVNYEITATFLDWTGTYGATSGNNTAFTFDAGGTLNMYLDPVLNYGSFATAADGTNILSLSIIQGTGNINFNNPAGLDGNVDILFQVTNAAAGYWFLDTNGDGLADTDVASLLLGGQYLTIALTDSNNNITTPTAAVAADFIASTGLGNPTGPGDIYTLNDGSATIGAVPEPGTLALLGLGFLGLSKATRRKV